MMKWPGSAHKVRGQIYQEDEEKTNDEFQESTSSGVYARLYP